MVGKEEKGRAFKPHYMLARKPQADMDIRKHTQAHSQEIRK